MRLRVASRTSDPKQLEGHEAIAEVSNKTEDERAYANIEQFFPLRENGFRQAQEAAHEAKEAPEPPANDDGYVEGEEEPLPDWD
jgi:hypothetical protein